MKGMRSKNKGSVATKLRSEGEEGEKLNYGHEVEIEEQNKTYKKEKVRKGEI